MAKNTKNTKNTDNMVVATPLTFGEKLQKVNVALELLRIDSEIAKKTLEIEKLEKKDELSKEDVEKIEKLSTEKAILRVSREKFVERFGFVSLDDVTNDLFAFVCAWSINPQKGTSCKDGDNEYHDITFNGMYKVVGNITTYAKKYLYNENSKEQEADKKELVEILDSFVNKYIPHEKSDIQLTPCENTTFKLTFGKFEKDTEILSEREFGYPKNCMENGYKPMNVHFVDTKEKPMLTDLLTFVRGNAHKWSKNGIVRGKVNDYAIIQQVFLIALKYNLNFNANTKTVTVTSKHVI